MVFDRQCRWLPAALGLLAPASVESLRVPPAAEAPEGAAWQQQGPERSTLGSSKDRLASYETKATWTGKHGTEEEFVSAYQALVASLALQEGMSHSAHVLEYVAGRPGAPALSKAGCLYLPHNSVWREFYDSIHHPDPRLFAEMIAASYYPNCGKTSVQGTSIRRCVGEGGGPVGAPRRIQGATRCIDVERASSARNVTIMVSDGMVGLPEKWRNHLDRVQQRREPPHRESAGDACNSSTLAEVPRGHKLVIPARYVVCMASDNPGAVDKQMIREQNAWTNDGFAGRSPWNRMSFESDEDRPQQVDMQIEFKFVDVQFVQDSICAMEGFYDLASVAKYVNNTDEQVTVVLVGDDSSGILGMSPLPMDSHGDPPGILVSLKGLRKLSSKRGDMDLQFDEGDTITHEAGHFLGLWHTFQGGCSHGDMVEDTAPEEFPSYICSRESSCGSPNPIHNFMDYTPDSCMMGFTEQQKRRAWCIIEHYKPALFRNTLDVGAAR